MGTKEEAQIARQQRDALIQLTSDVKHILIALDKQEQGQKDINGSMFHLHEKMDKRVDSIEKDIVAAKSSAKTVGWMAALGGGTGGAAFMAFITKIFNGGG